MNVYLRLYLSGHLLVEAQGNKQSINIHFINCHLKDLFMQVYNHAKPLELPPPHPSHKTPLTKLTKTARSILKKVKCPKCDFQTNITSHLAKHMKKTHGSSAARRLSISENPSSDEGDMMNSEKALATVSKIECELCGSDFSSESDRKIHVKDAHEHKCDACTSIFYDKYDLDLHMTTHMNKPKEIEQGNSIKSLREEIIAAGEIDFLENQTKETSDDEFIECIYCGTVFSDAEDLERHITKEHVHCNRAEQYHCDKCAFSSSEEVVLKHHTLMLHVPGFECNECKKIIFPDDLVAGCSNCGFFYHKQCTNLNLSHQEIDKAKSWQCHLCAPKISENDSIKICHLCNSEAPNSTSLETHMLNNHCPNIAAQCDVCDKRFEQEESFLLHVKFAHPIQQLSCIRCNKSFSTLDDLNTHNIEHAKLDTINTCYECKVLINLKDLSINCEVCSFQYHKKCTDLKKSGGHWKSAHWKCHYCRSKPIENDSSNPNTNATETLANIDKNTTKVSAKHRKSNINNEDPEKEFLRSQINTLKSIVAKREAELKKLEESDNLKAKRIMNLEAQLNEARKNNCDPSTSPVHTTTENLKIKNLESKTNTLEHQISILFSQMKNIKETSDKYSCNVCEKEPSDKTEKRDHITTNHTKPSEHRNIYTCDVCDCEFYNKTSLMSHKDEHRIEQIFCSLCEFSACNKRDLEIHHTREHFKCEQCSYYAIHNRDLRRHKNTMHAIVRPSDSKSMNDLQEHKDNEHRDKTFQCDQCEHTAKCNEELHFHISVAHKQKVRTRIFSSSRYQSSSKLSSANTNRDREIFRPWSLRTSSITTSSSNISSAPSNVTHLPRPFTSAHNIPNHISEY